MTAWDSQEDMRRDMTSGSHKAVMPRLMHWCDEACVTHWTQPAPALPTWEEADRRMRESGRASKVLHPSPHHESLTYRAPRTTGGYPSQSKTIHLTQISKCDKVLLAGL